MIVFSTSFCKQGEITMPNKPTCCSLIKTRVNIVKSVQNIIIKMPLSRKLHYMLKHQQLVKINLLKR